MLTNRRAIIGSVSASLLLILTLPACDDDETTTTAAPPAEELCLDFRNAVTALRFGADGADGAADFTAAADAAGAAAEGTAPEDLSTGGQDYIDRLGVLTLALEDAAAAKEEGDDEAFNRALDVAEPTDDIVDGLAADGGLSGCVLGAVAEDEQGISQSGFPALAVPGDSPPTPPEGNEAIIFPLADGTVIRLLTLGSIDTGTVPVEDAAAEFESGFGAEFATLEQVGDSGNQLVPMLEYSYAFDSGENGAMPGIAHVFSGQGRIWALDCGATSEEEGITPELQTACDRAVETLGFLMF